jgi:hypothetical protein
MSDTSAAPPTMKCNLCDGVTWVDMNGRIGMRCEQCNSLERTRLIWMYLQKLELRPDAKILHLAPEKGIYRQLRKRVKKENYITTDYDPSIYTFAKNCRKLDLCDMENEPSGEYDLILHLHVLEHIPCNIAYPLYHLHRMLKEDGRHMFALPIIGGWYDESFEPIGDEGRHNRFGQFDHVRKFGVEDLGTNIGSLMKMPTEFDASKDFSPEVLRAANVPENIWRGFTTSTIFNFGKYDMKLLPRPPAPAPPMGFGQRLAALFTGGR